MQHLFSKVSRTECSITRGGLVSARSGRFKQGLLRRIGSCTPLLLWFHASSLWAETPHSSHPTPDETVVYLSLSDAIEKGAEQGPAVAVAVAPRAATQAAVEAANPIANQVPVVQGQVGPRISNGRVTPELIVSLSQQVPWVPTGRVQERLALARRQLVDKDIELTRLDSGEQAGHAWIDLAYADGLLVLRKAVVEEAEHNLKLIEARVRTGETDAVALAMAQGELAANQALVLDAEGLH